MAVTTIAHKHVFTSSKPNHFSKAVVACLKKQQISSASSHFKNKEYITACKRTVSFTGQTTGSCSQTPQGGKQVPKCG
jgi:hypothetical protein